MHTYRSSWSEHRVSVCFSGRSWPEDAHHCVSSGSGNVSKSTTCPYSHYMMNTEFSLNRKTCAASWLDTFFFCVILKFRSDFLSFLSLPLQADLCVPRLNEGDQVVLINGRDISDHTHDQVVMFIKASCESHSGELILLVRPNGELFPSGGYPLL